MCSMSVYVIVGSLAFCDRTNSIVSARNIDIQIWMIKVYTRVDDPGGKTDTIHRTANSSNILRNDLWSNLPGFTTCTAFSTCNDFCTANAHQ